MPRSYTGDQSNRTQLRALDRFAVDTCCAYRRSINQKPAVLSRIRRTLLYYDSMQQHGRGCPDEVQA